MSFKGPPHPRCKGAKRVLCKVPRRPPRRVPLYPHVLFLVPRPHVLFQVSRRQLLKVSRRQLLKVPRHQLLKVPRHRLPVSRASRRRQPHLLSAFPRHRRVPSIR